MSEDLKHYGIVVGDIVGTAWCLDIGHRIYSVMSGHWGGSSCVGSG